VPLAYPDPPLADDLVSLRAWRKGDIATVIEADHQDELHDLAQRIRAGAATGTIPLVPEEDEEGVLEGRIVWRWHRQRERAPRKAAEKKAKMRGDLGELRCEVCGFSETDVAKRFGALTGDIFKCHHTKPLHLLTGTTKTRIADLTVLCPTCHRSLHRIEPSVTVSEMRSRATAAGSVPTGEIEKAPAT
jgi:5-methylcytosine-specific restriction enzyme A